MRMSAQRASTVKEFRSSLYSQLTNQLMEIIQENKPVGLYSLNVQDLKLISGCGGGEETLFWF